MAGGLGAFMCASCLDHYAGVAAEHRRSGREDPPPWDGMSDADLLGRLPLIAQTGAQVDRYLVDWVRLVRGRGLSWAQVGGALGISRQAAWERFARAVEPRPAEVPRHAEPSGAGSA